MRKCLSHLFVRNRAQNSSSINAMCRGLRSQPAVVYMHSVSIQMSTLTEPFASFYSYNRQDAQSFLFTFENNGKNAMDLFYVDSPLIEHKMGTVEANGDMTHRVMTGQTFAARILNEDFRVMFQIDHIDYEEGAEAGPEFKITFINIVSPLRRCK